MAYRFFFIYLSVCSMPAKLDNIDVQLKLAIAKRFEEIRKHSGKTQEAFAHGSGRDKQSYNKNEKGKGATIYTINKFCFENDISLKQFFDSPLFVKKKNKE
jgi:transcriptional regulator with XRE-family HTH domain